MTQALVHRLEVESPELSTPRSSQPPAASPSGTPAALTWSALYYDCTLEVLSDLSFCPDTLCNPVELAAQVLFAPDDLLLARRRLLACEVETLRSPGRR